MATAFRKTKDAVKKKFGREKSKKTDEKSEEQQEREEQSKSSSTTKKKGGGKEFTSLPDVVKSTPNGKAPLSLPLTLGEGPSGSVQGSDVKSAQSKSTPAEGPAVAAAAAAEVHGSNHEVSTEGASHKDECDTTFMNVGEPSSLEIVSEKVDTIHSTVNNNQELNLSDDVRDEPPKPNSEVSGDGIISTKSPHSQERNQTLASADHIFPPHPNSEASRDGAMGSESHHSEGVNPADPACVGGVVPPEPMHADEVVHPNPNSEVGVMASESPHGQEINPANPSHADRVAPPDPNSQASGSGLVDLESHHSQELNNAANADRLVPPDPNSQASGSGLVDLESHHSQELDNATNADRLVPPEPNSQASGEEVSISGHSLQHNQAIDAASAGGITESLNYNRGTTVPAAADPANAAAAAATGAPQNPAEEATRGITATNASLSGQERIVAEAAEPPQSLTHAPIQEEAEESTTHDETTQQEAEANSYDHCFVSDLKNKDKLFLEDKLAGELDRTSHRVIKTWEHLSCTEEVNAPLETRLQCKLNSENSCTLMLIDFLAVEKGDKTVGDLVVALKADAVKRHDVVKIITDAHPDAEHSTEKISDFVASDANRELIKKMATKLDQQTRVIGYWKNLGQQFQISGEKLKEIECGQFNPTLALMEYLYSKQADLTVRKFHEEVKKLNRNDVVKKLDSFLAAHGEEHMKNVIEPESDVMRSICVCLNNSNRVLKNWRNLANAFNVPRDIYKDFNPKEPKRPTILLLEWIYANKPELTLGQLCNALRHIDRNDVVRDIRKYFEQQLTTDGTISDQN